MQSSAASANLAFVQPASSQPAVAYPALRFSAPAPEDRQSAADNTGSSGPLVGFGVAAAAVAVGRAAKGAQRSRRAGRAVSLQAFESDTGVQAPLGFWDPLGLSASGNLSDYARRREVELKHGRVSMFATIGYIVPEYYKIPGFCSPSYGVKFFDIPNGLGAISKVPALGWLQTITFLGLIEVQVYNENVNGEPGNYGAGFLGLRSVGIMNLGVADAELRKKKLNAELANGRLAMMAIIGMFFQDGCTGSAWGDWALYTESPLRAFEGELGVQAPVGFWDPLGLAADGDAAVFKRRRETEIKHGRISMIACMGYITPEYFKFPGYLSPKLSLLFSDIPNGLAAFSKVPGQGWAQVVVFAGLHELFIFKPTAEPGNYGTGWPAIAIGKPIADAEARKKKLSAELANGRLAMMAIMGMLFQDGLTGSAWGDWALYTASPLRAVDFSKEMGALPPLGFWDPLGFSEFDRDDLAAAQFSRRRSVELQHGRVSMLACIGYIVPEYFKWPGFCSPALGLKFADIPNGLAALSKVPLEGWFQMSVFAGVLEVTNLGGEPTGVAGDFPNFGAYGIIKAGGIADPEKKKKALTAELSNGRLAMMAIIGMFFQDGLTGQAWGDWSLYTDSPLRGTGLSSPGFNMLPEWEKPLNGFEGNIGDQAPLGFWDPAGFARDGDVQKFTKRRAVEIKHGRVSMLATIGYIVPEYFKLPGELSPSLSVKFADVPTGLGALSKVPQAGIAQIVAFAGFLELSYNTPYGEPGNYGKGFLGLGSVGVSAIIADPDKRATKLAAELANGRLAMMAIIGMFFQDGLTGSAWGDWAVYTDSPLRAFESELGVQAPLGFWDPMGFSTDGDVEDFKRRRTSEIKHGRVAMYAAMGYIVPEYYKFPGFCSTSMELKFSDIPNGLAAVAKVPVEGWMQWVALCGLYEVVVNEPVSANEPGNYGKGALGFTGKSIEDPEKRKRSLNSEIANGRLAMMAIIGMFFQDGLTGSAWGDWALFTASPLRAFEGELGVQPPVGFWDPLNFTGDGDAERFRRRRTVELKHGRVSMLACMGYITPYYYKFEGELSPSLGLKFSDVPNGLAAISKVPTSGIWQWISFAGALELFYFQDDPKRAPGDFAKGGVLGVPIGNSMADGDAKKKKLSAELANGRLAMMAIIGMFFQDGLTGSAWGDWSLYTDSPLRAFENELGVQAPLGFWDPLGLAAEGSAADFRRRRASELKHGRVSMIACMGYIAPEYFKFPGALAPHLGLNFADVPNGLAALSKVPAYGIAQWVFFCGLIEKGLFKDDPSRAPGDFERGGTLGVPNAGGPMENEELRKRKLSSEIANGRLAMMAIMGMMFQDGLTGSAWGDWALYTASPLRAFESELGVQAPVGYWDPLGLAKDGDAGAFARRRSTEIKHGRVSMIACMGYILPEYLKFPGFLSPKAGLAFADVPNGLAAISKVPGAGICQWIAFCGALEFNIFGTEKAPGDFANAGSLGLPFAAGVTDPESRKRKLNAELANGRLAMMAITGMLFQDGLTGAAWGDWSLYVDSPLRAAADEESIPWTPLAYGLALGLLTATPALAADLENGGQVFNANCASCHVGGNNTIVAEKKLKKEALITYGKYEVDKIMYQVTNGNGQMPAFGERLAPEDIEDVASYVRSQADKGW